MRKYPAEEDLLKFEILTILRTRNHVFALPAEFMFSIFRRLSIAKFASSSAREFDSRYTCAIDQSDMKDNSRITSA